MTSSVQLLPVVFSLAENVSIHFYFFSHFFFFVATFKLWEELRRTQCELDVVLSTDLNFSFGFISS